MLFSIELWRQWQPLMFPPIHPLNGALRCVNHERRDEVMQNDKIQEQIHGMQTQQGVLLSDSLVVQKRLG